MEKLREVTAAEDGCDGALPVLKVHLELAVLLQLLEKSPEISDDVLNNVSLVFVANDLLLVSQDFLDVLYYLIKSLIIVITRCKYEWQELIDERARKEENKVQQMHTFSPPEFICRPRSLVCKLVSVS